MALSDLSLPGRELRLLPPLARSDATELMDAETIDPVELAGNLRDIRRVNRLLGGTAIILRHLPVILATIPGTQSVSLLDLATGSADIPVAVSRWAKRTGQALSIVASDASAEMLSAARAHIVGHPKITLARYDARAVPLPDRSFDVVLCSLALHHFVPEEAMLVLREMNRLARAGFILNDLCRSRVGLAAAWAAGHLTTRNRLTRHDAPLSVRRAYTPVELDDLLRRAGINDAIITTHPWFRMAAVRVARGDG
jgi:SAM-dependent methyltransferase